MDVGNGGVLQRPASDYEELNAVSPSILRVSSKGTLDPADEIGCLQFASPRIEFTREAFFNEASHLSGITTLNS